MGIGKPRHRNVTRAGELPRPVGRRGRNHPVNPGEVAAAAGERYIANDAAVHGVLNASGCSVIGFTLMFLRWTNSMRTPSGSRMSK